MLIVKRRVGQKLVIGDGPGAVTVEVRRAEGGEVYLAFDAPREVVILRGELAARAALHRAAKGETPCKS